MARLSRSINQTGSSIPAVTRSAPCVNLKFSFDDFFNVVTGQVGTHKDPRPQGRDLLVFIGGKVVFFSLAFLIPMLLHADWAVLAIYATAAFVSGVVLSVVFQLAIAWEKPTFPCRSRARRAGSGRRRSGSFTRCRRRSILPGAIACSAGSWAG